MSKVEQYVEDREFSMDMLETAFQDKDTENLIETVDAEIVPKLGMISASETAITTLDGIKDSGGDDYSFARDIVSMVQRKDFPIASDALDSAFSTLGRFGTDKDGMSKMGVTLDGAMEIRGADLVLQLAKLNFLSIVNSNIPNVVGEIGDFIADTHSSPIGGGTAFKIYDITDVVTDGKGELATDTELDSKTIFTPVTTLVKEENMKVEANKLSYVFNVKKQKDATSNYPLRVGHQEVIIVGTGISFSDITAKNKNSNFSEHVTVNGKKITFEVDYAGGKVTLTLEEDGVLDVDTLIMFKASMSSKKTSETRTYFGGDISHETYVGELVNMGAKINQIDDAEIVRNLGVHLLPRGLRIAEQKRSAELIGRTVAYIVALAKEYKRLDISGDSYSTRSEKYKAVMNVIAQASKTISEDTMIAGAGRLACFGGKDLIQVMTYSDKSDTPSIVPTNANGFQYLGMLDNTYPCYYHPLYDELSPKDGDYINFTVCGMPFDPARRIVLKGMPIPVMPVTNVGSNTDLEIDIPVTGQQILSINKRKTSQKLSRKIYIKD